VVLNDQVVFPQKRRLSISSQILAEVSVVILWISMLLSGLKTFTIAGHIDIALWDIAALIAFFLWFSYMALSGQRIPQHVVIALNLVFLFAMVVGIQALRSPQPIRGLTMFLLLLRNIVLLLMTASLANRLKHLERLNKAIFFVGIGIAFLSIVLFLNALKDFSTITGMRRPYGGIILLVDEGGIPRLIGFAGDPNFYALWMSLALFCGLYAKNMCRLTKIAGIVLIMLSIAFTLSRSAYLFLVASTALLLGILFYLHKTPLGLRPIKLLVIGGSILAIALITVRPFNIEFIENLTYRFSKISSAPRFAMWEELTRNPEGLILGSGLRAAEVTLEAYSHNSYLDVLFETGIIGLAFFGLFVLSTTKRGIVLLRWHSDLLPWFHSWLFTLFMFLTLSLVYNPFPWLIAGLLWSQRRKESS
jgi:O-antigen ligase